MAKRTALKTRAKGSGTIYRVGKRWYLKVRIGDKAKVKRLCNEDGTPCTREDKAIEAADGYRKILLAEDKEEMALQIAEAKKIRKQSTMTLSEVWQCFVDAPNRQPCAPKTLRGYENIWSLFYRWIIKTHPEINNLSGIDEDIASEYFTHIWKTGISAKRYNDEVMSLRFIFRHIARQAALDSNPFTGIQKKTLEIQSRRAFTSEQVAAIFRGFDEGFFYETEVEKLTTGRKRERVTQRLEYKPMHAEEMRVLLNLCCWTGCRGQDGCLMQWKNVDLDKGIISFVPRKTAKRTGNRAVTLPLHPTLREALIAALQWRGQNADGEDYILPKVAHRYLYNHSGVQKDVMKIIRCATGLETTAAKADTIGRRKLAANAYSLHSFRHTFVSFCANAGIPLAIVAEIVGHGNPAMTEHYSHISTEAKQGAINALPVLSITQAPPKEQGPEKQGTGEAPGNLRARVLEAISRMKTEELEEFAKNLSSVS